MAQGHALVNHSSQWCTADTLGLEITQPVTLCSLGMLANQRVLAQLGDLCISEKGSWHLYDTAQLILFLIHMKARGSALWFNIKLLLLINYRKKSFLVPCPSPDIVHPVVFKVWELQQQSGDLKGSQLMRQRPDKWRDWFDCHCYFDAPIFRLTPVTTKVLWSFNITQHQCKTGHNTQLSHKNNDECKLG